MSSSCFRQTYALFIKHNTIRLRAPISLVLEILLPLLFIIGMYLLSTQFSTDHFSAAQHTSADDVAQVLPFFSIPVALARAGSGGLIAVSGSTADGSTAAAAFFASASLLYPSIALSQLAGGALVAADASGILAQITLPGFVNCSRYFASASDIDDYIASANYGTASAPSLYAAIVFNSGPPSLDYVIRMNSSAVPATTGFNVNTYSNAYRSNSFSSYQWAKTPDPEGGNGASKLGPLTPSQYSIDTPGFLTLQLAVDRWAINATVPVSQLDETVLLNLFQVNLFDILFDTQFDYALNSLDATQRAQLADDLRYSILAGEAMTPQQIDLVPFPVGPYTRNLFFQLALYPLLMLFVIAFVYPVSRLISSLVQEKELKLRESMRIMGTSDTALLGSWFIAYGLSYTILAVLITMVGTGLFPNSSSSIVFAVFWSFGLSTISLSIFISVFFTQSKVASVIGSAAFIATYFAFFALSSTTSAPLKTLACLLSPTSLAAGLEVMATLETAGVGANKNTAFTTIVNNWTVGGTIFMNFFDTALFLLLAAYADAVLPAALRDFGTPRPFYFPFTLSFWREVFGFAPASKVSGSSSSSFSLNSNTSTATATATTAPTTTITQNPITAALQWALGRRNNYGGSGSVSESLLGDSNTTSGSNNAATTFIEPLDAALKAKAAAGRSVSLRGLKKEFETPDGVKVAVDSIDLDFFEGQIFVLLGHNGAGKTTTISMLTGLVPPTSGDINVFGRSLDDLGAIRKDLGVCPQHDVLWPELTVIEHLRLFAALKGVPAADVEAESAKSLELVGLTEKALVRVAALSGGQKRKLSVCIAFMGGSKVIFLDEPTSGMDPYSRRSTWNILQNAREGRVIVLTTHFMDEADILGDRIAIMADGRVKCCGSPLFLKESYGIGYTLTAIRDGPDAPVLDLVKKYVPVATISSSAGAELALRVPIEAAGVFAPLLRELQGPAGAAVGVRGVGVGVTSVEDVFMRVAAGDDGGNHHNTATVKGSDTTSRNSDDLADVNLQRGGKSTLADVRAAARKEMSPFYAFTTHFGAIVIKRSRYARRDARAVCCLLLIPVIALVGGLSALLSATWGVQPDLILSSSQFNNDGNRGISGVPQFPNYVPTFAFKSGSNATSSSIAALIAALPTGASGASTAGYETMSEMAASASDTLNPYNFITSDSYPLRDWQRLASQLLATATTTGDGASKYGAYIFEGVNTILPSQDSSNVINSTGINTDAPLTYTAFCNTTAVHGAPIFINLLHSAVVRISRGWSGVTIHSHPLPLTPYEQRGLLAAQSFSITQVVMLALSFVTPAFLQFIVREREVKAKHQQLISGISIFAYWAANLAFDYATFILPATLTLITLKSFDAGALVSFETDNVLAFIALLAAYGLSGAAFTYSISHIFSSPATAGAAAVMLNILLFAAVLACAILSQLETTCRAVPIVKGILNFFPFFAFGYGLSNIAVIKTLPTSLSACDIYHNDFSKTYPAFTSSFQSGVAGTSLTYLCVTTVFYLGLAIFIDYARNDMSLRTTLRVCMRRARGRSIKDDPPPPQGTFAIDQAVALEASRAEIAASSAALGAVSESTSLLAAESGLRSGGDHNNNSSSPDAILLSHIRKSYDPPLTLCARRAVKKVAVVDLSFGVQPGGVFGFLGINGAGKSTTLKMLSGDELPDGGSAYLAGYDIVKEQASVRRLLGYCPQFDALLDLLTTREHLELYARIKGVSRSDLNRVVDAKLAEFDLLPFAGKLAGRLSGGNKRKLSVAIALIGDPPIIFLDEPSTGVDPIAKRYMWRVISRVATERKQCSIILTTHSMEEVAALSTNIGIMVGGRLRCLGSAQELRSAHGAGFSLELRLAPATKDDVDIAISTLTKTGLLQSSPGGGELVLPLSSLSTAIHLLGADPTATMSAITPHGSGWAVAAAFASSPSQVCGVSVWAAWWAEECRSIAAQHAVHIAPEFNGARLLERQGALLKFRIPRGTALADLFDAGEKVRASLGTGTTLTLGETSLEEIFNQMAAEQEEERGVARGTMLENAVAPP